MPIKIPLDDLAVPETNLEDLIGPPAYADAVSDDIQVFLDPGLAPPVQWTGRAGNEGPSDGSDDDGDGFSFVDLPGDALSAVWRAGKTALDVLEKTDNLVFQSPFKLGTAALASVYSPLIRDRREDFNLGEAWKAVVSPNTSWSEQLEKTAGEDRLPGWAEVVLDVAATAPAIFLSGGTAAVSKTGQTAQVLNKLRQANPHLDDMARGIVKMAYGDDVVTKIDDSDEMVRTAFDVFTDKKLTNKVVDDAKKGVNWVEVQGVNGPVQVSNLGAIEGTLKAANALHTAANGLPRQAFVRYGPWRLNIGDKFGFGIYTPRNPNSRLSKLTKFARFDPIEMGMHKLQSATKEMRSVYYKQLDEVFGTAAAAEGGKRAMSAADRASAHIALGMGYIGGDEALRRTVKTLEDAGQWSDDLDKMLPGLQKLARMMNKSDVFHLDNVDDAKRMKRVLDGLHEEGRALVKAQPKLKNDMRSALKALRKEGFDESSDVFRNTERRYMNQIRRVRQREKRVMALEDELSDRVFAMDQQDYWPQAWKARGATWDDVTNVADDVDESDDIVRTFGSIDESSENLGAAEAALRQQVDEAEIITPKPEWETLIARADDAGSVVDEDGLIRYLDEPRKITNSQEALDLAAKYGDDVVDSRLAGGSMFNVTDEEAFYRTLQETYNMSDEGAGALFSRLRQIADETSTAARKGRNQFVQGKAYRQGRRVVPVLDARVTLGASYQHVMQKNIDDTLDYFFKNTALYADEANQERLRTVADPLRYERKAEQMAGSLSRKSIGLAYRRWMSKYKAWLTTTNPAHYVRNMMGDFYNSMINGEMRHFMSPYMPFMTNTRGLANYNRKVLNKMYDIGGTQMSGTDIVMATRLSGMGHGFVGDDINLFVNLARSEPVLSKGGIRPFGGRVRNRLSKLNMEREDAQRLLTLVRHMKHGDDWFTAAAKTMRVHFDYGQLTPIERLWLRNSVMFYTWARRNTPLQWGSFFTRPAIPAMAQRIGEARPVEGWEPDWRRNMIPVGLPGLELGGVGLPFFTFSHPLAAVTEWQPSNAMDSLVGSASPILKLPMEYAMNKRHGLNEINRYQGETANFRDASMQRNWLGEIAKWAGIAEGNPVFGTQASRIGTEGEPRGATNAYVDWLLKSFQGPLGSYAQGALQPGRGEYRTDPLTEVLGFSPVHPRREYFDDLKDYLDEVERRNQRRREGERSGEG